MYASFFDPKPAGRWNRRGEEYDEQRSWHEDESDGEGGEEARALVGGDRWDGDALFDTGEGRDSGIRPTPALQPAHPHAGKYLVLIQTAQEYLRAV